MVEHTIVPTSKMRLIAILQVALWPISAYGLLLMARYYSGHISQLSLRDQLPWLRGYLAVIAGALALSAFLSGRAGWRIWRSGQYPAPGTAVLFTTRVSTGLWARANAIAVFLACAVLVLFLAAFLNYFVFSEAGVSIIGLRGCEA